METFSPAGNFSDRTCHTLGKLGTPGKETLIGAIGRALGIFSTEDVGGFCIHCGYRTPIQ